jgi:hypothetical protein
MTRAYMLMADAQAMKEYAEFLLRKTETAPTLEVRRRKDFILEMVTETESLLAQVKEKLNG